jgi:hypothetical protein
MKQKVVEDSFHRHKDHDSSPDSSPETRNRRFLAGHRRSAASGTEHGSMLGQKTGMDWAPLVWALLLSLSGLGSTGLRSGLAALAAVWPTPSSARVESGRCPPSTLRDHWENLCLTKGIL